MHQCAQGTFGSPGSEKPSWKDMSAPDEKGTISSQSMSACKVWHANLPPQSCSMLPTFPHILHQQAGHVFQGAHRVGGIELSRPLKVPAADGVLGRPGREQPHGGRWQPGSATLAHADRLASTCESVERNQFARHPARAAAPCLLEQPGLQPSRWRPFTSGQTNICTWQACRLCCGSFGFVSL